MELILCAGNAGEPMGRVLLNEIVGLGYAGVRVDIPDDHAQAEAVIGELKQGPYAIFLIAGGTMTRADGSPWHAGSLVAHVRDVCVKLRDFGLFALNSMAIEIGNEPDLACDEWKDHPELLARTFERCYATIREFSTTVPVLCPSVSNLNRRGFNYLDKMLKTGAIPENAGLAFHRYPHDGDPEKPHPGFVSRDDQASKIVEMADGRDLWLTETGLTEGPHKKTSPEFHSEEFVADTYDYEVAFWSRVPNMRAFTWYQINDGPDEREQLHHYGIRRMDGSWKPVARRAGETK